jgi:transcriptional regulator with XRE-family HTH domain
LISKRTNPYDEGMPQAPTLDEVIGANLRSIRKQRGWTQHDLERELRGGLGWTRSYVAAIEAGRKRILVAELIYLSDVLRVAPVSLLAGDGPVRHGDAPPTYLSDVRQVLMTPPGHEPPAMQASEAPAAAAEARARLREDMETAKGEAEQRAAHKLRVHPVVVVTHARLRWGRSLTEERDARVGPATGDRRATQARRGWVTRELVAELEQALKGD